MVISELIRWLATVVASTGLMAGTSVPGVQTNVASQGTAVRMFTASPSTGSAAPRGLYQFLGQVHPENAANPNVDGALLVFTWSQVEPSKGVFDWAPIEAAIQPWSSAGKKVALRIHTASSARFNAGWNGGTAGQATPSWVYAEGVRSVIDPDGSVLPVYWDAAYQHEYWAMVRAFAGRYNADPRVAFVEAASGFDGESMVEPSAATGALARWQTIGYTDALWQQTVYWSWDVYRHWFTLPVAVEDKGLQVSGINSFRLFADHAVRAGLWVDHNGLTQTGYTWNYAAALHNASGNTGCVLAQKDKLPVTDIGAAQLTLQMTTAISAGCRVVMIYPAEVAAATAGSITYRSAWDAAIAQAHADLWKG